jgi:hypothetical protein
MKLKESVVIKYINFLKSNTYVIQIN